MWWTTSSPLPTQGIIGIVRNRNRRPVNRFSFRRFQRNLSTGLLGLLRRLSLSAGRLRILGRGKFSLLLGILLRQPYLPDLRGEHRRQLRQGHRFFRGIYHCFDLCS